MVQTSTTSYISKCDWCGTEKQGRLEENNFAEIAVQDAEWRKENQGTYYGFVSSFTRSGRRFDLCPECYESVRVFFKRMQQDKKQQQQQLVNNDGVKRKSKKQNV